MKWKPMEEASALLAAGAFAMLTSCATNTMTGRTQKSFISDDESAQAWATRSAMRWPVTGPRQRCEQLASNPAVKIVSAATAQNARGMQGNNAALSTDAFARVTRRSPYTKREPANLY